jgi:hypothetical protein
MFFEDNSFRWVELFDSGTIAVSSGQCEKIIAPK